MSRRRSLLVVGVAAAVLGAGTVSAEGVWAQLAHPRDPAAFQDYMTTYVAGWGSSADPLGPQRDQTWVDDHPDLVLAAGERACRWLAEQPSAPDLDRSGSSSVHGMAVRFLASQDRPSTGLSRMGSLTLVSGAWGYLCWSTREDRTAPQSEGDD